MKKRWVWIVILAMLLFVACGNGGGEETSDEPSKFIGTWISVAYEDEDGIMALERGYEDVLSIVVRDDGVMIIDPDDDPVEGTWVDEGDALVGDKGTEDELVFPYEDGVLKMDIEGNTGYFVKEGTEITPTEQKLYDEAVIFVDKDGEITFP